MRTHLRLSVLAGLSLPALLAIGVLANPASAAGYSGNCGSSSVNPKDPDNGLSNYSAYRSTTLYGRTINLVAGRNNIALYGWAQISGPTAGSDRVWMDWSTNYGSSWSQCGPETVDTAGTTGFTRALATGGSNVKFRACGDVLVSGVRQHTCTTWW
jgi:hypothetical protein